MKMFVFAGNFRTLEFHVVTREVDYDISTEAADKIFAEELSNIDNLVLAGDDPVFLVCNMYLECDFDLFMACKDFVDIICDSHDSWEADNGI